MFMRSVVMVWLLWTVSAAFGSDAALVEWARQRARPLTPDSTAFRALDDGVRRARLIGVGESVHEAEPFASFRRRLLEDLVRRHRVTALVLESGLPEVMAVDDYVLGRTATIDFEAAMPGLGGLDEVRKTVEWLRHWNRTEGKGRPVRVYGADLSGRSGSMLPALDQLAELVRGDQESEALIGRIRPVALQLSSRFWRPAAQKYDALPAETRAQLAIDVSLLADRAALRKSSNPHHDQWARRLAQLLERNEEHLRVGTYVAVAPRDHALAENVLWVVSTLRAGERAVYWAHNAHIQKALVQGGPLPPGKYLGSGMRLAAALGDHYYAIGTAYGGSSIDDQTPPRPGSLDEVMARVAETPFLLQLAPPPANIVALSEERLMRFQAGYLTLPIAPAFDAIVYFDRAQRNARK